MRHKYEIKILRIKMTTVIMKFELTENYNESIFVKTLKKIKIKIYVNKI